MCSDAPESAIHVLEIVATREQRNADALEFLALAGLTTFSTPVCLAFFGQLTNLCPESPQRKQVCRILPSADSLACCLSVDFPLFVSAFLPHLGFEPVASVAGFDDGLAEFVMTNAAALAADAFFWILCSSTIKRSSRFAYVRSSSGAPFHIATNVSYAGGRPVSVRIIRKKSGNTVFACWWTAASFS